MRLRAQVKEIARRSVLRTLRQPSLIVPPIVFPLTLLAVNVSGLDAATGLPGFPGDSYLDFALAFIFVQGSLFAMTNGGTDLARDIESGFIKRLALTPMQRTALLVGHLSGVMVVSFLAICIYTAVGFIAGAHMKAGAGGVPVLLALALLIALAFAAVGTLVALRFGSGEAVQGVFPLMFVLLFLSSMNLPRDLIEQDWFRTIATYNPISYLIEGLRSLFISGWDGEALALGFGFAALIAAGAIFAATRALRTRVVRT